MLAILLDENGAEIYVICILLYIIVPKSKKKLLYMTNVTFFHKEVYT